jgi:hypothetical protein
MPKPTIDPIVAALDSALPTAGGQRPKLLVLYGDRPEVLEAVVRARTSRGLSYEAIAKVLTKNAPEGESVSAGAVKKWLDAQSIH